MNRRGFLAMLGGTAAAATLDPERLLWVPGRKTISIPSPGIMAGLECKAIRVFDLDAIRPTPAGDKVTSVTWRIDPYTYGPVPTPLWSIR